MSTDDSQGISRTSDDGTSDDGTANGARAAEAHPHDAAPERDGELILEGRFVVERAISMGVVPRRVLTTRATLEKLRDLPAQTRVEVLERDALSRIAGYNFHRGCIGFADRPSSGDDLEPGLESSIGARIGARIEAIRAGRSTHAVVVALDRITDPVNLGAIFRSCRALGATHVVMNASCADPWQRRVIRTSMANVFALRPTVVADLGVALDQLRETLAATVVAAHVSASSVDVAAYTRPPGPLVLVLGNEGHGISESVLQRCDVAVEIPVHEGSDSLNVSVAAGILLERLRWPGPIS